MSQAENPRLTPPGGKTGRRKIAVLGGGCGSLATVWTLTQIPDWQKKYDITVYQVGWRLGGKCASGRNAAYGQRIEEHGLHVWAGFYENGFRLMQQCYGELPPDPENPIRGWQDAFRKRGAVLLEESIGGKWLDWPMLFPENDDVPGTGGEMPSVWDYIQLVINFMVERVEAHESGGCAMEGNAGHGGHASFASPRDPKPAQVQSDAQAQAPLAAQVGAVLPRTGPATEPVRLWQRLFPSNKTNTPLSLLGYAAHDILAAAKHYVSALDPDPTQHFAEDHRDLIVMLEAAVRHFETKVDDSDLADDCRRLNIILDLAYVVVKGLLVDGAIFFGFHTIDDVEWRDWLRHHGAREATIDSAVVRGIYDYVFGFFQGRASQPSIEAGTAINGVLRLFFTYKGSLFWMMQAGMGDIVFAPLYRVLKQRGVRFRFFHKIQALRLSEDRHRIASIELERQVAPKAGEYEPLIRVKGVPSWPSLPLFDQLVQGEDLKAQKINLESAWTPWRGDPMRLEAGTDFDDVVLGLSIAAAKIVCGDLLAAGGRFADMLTKVQTVQTGAMQLWFGGDAAALGAPEVPRICSAYADDLNTWADMSFLLPREAWGTGPNPGYIAYLCGQFPDAETIPPFSDTGFPAREAARFRQAAAAWLDRNAAHAWNKTGAPGGGFDWSRLFDPSNGSGPARLSSQYLRINIDPTERYVLSLPGTSKFRLRAGDSGYANLFLTGDWVRTSINAGCVEAAVMAGMDAAHAISGEPVDIIGGIP